MAATKLLVSGHQSIVGECELCLQSSIELTDNVTVEDELGRITVFAACERCGRAMRRIVAIIGPDSTSVAAGATATVTAPPVEVRRPVMDGPPELIQQLVERMMVDSRRYVAKVYGCPRTDGTWAAWLVFVEQSTGEMRRTDIETTQPNMAAVRYWASGLEPTYLEGAFTRANMVTSVIPQVLLSGQSDYRR